MRAEPFLLGIIASLSLVASIFFFKFGQKTRDSLFLCFGVAFLIEAANRTAVIFVQNPSEGSPLIYVIRLLAFLIILGGILHKNYGGQR